MMDVGRCVQAKEGRLTMKAKVIVGTAVALGAGILTLGLAIGQTQEHKMPSPEEMKAMMDKWMATTKPSEHHKKLEPLVGEWDTVTKVYWGGPGSPPAETKGTSSIKWILGGRFIAQEFSGQAMMPDAAGGMHAVPFEGFGMTGYDNYKNMYMSTWADSLNTYLLTSSGAADPSGKVFTMYGQMDEAMLDVHGRYVKTVHRIINDNKSVFEIYDLHAGPDYKVIEITYTRR